MMAVVSLTAEACPTAVCSCGAMVAASWTPMPALSAAVPACSTHWPRATRSLAADEDQLGGAETSLLEAALQLFSRGHLNSLWTLWGSFGQEFDYMSGVHERVIDTIFLSWR